MLQRSSHTSRHLVYCGLVLSAGFVSAGLSPARALDPTGDWQVEDAVAVIRVAECNGSMWGAVTWEKIAGGVDKWNGKFYDALDSGKLYSASIKPKGPNELEIEGCLVWPLCGSQTWTRVGPPIPSSPTNSMAKGSTAAAPAKPGLIARITGTAPKPANGAAPAPAPATAATPAAGAPKAATPVATAAKAPAGQKTAAATGQAADIGDICLLPEIVKASQGAAAK